MKTHVSLIAVMCVAGAIANTARSTEAPVLSPVPESAAEWLAAVRARLPIRPTWIKGWLGTDGHPPLNIEVLLDLGHTPPTARYGLSDAFGRDLEEITLWRATELRRRYRRGSPLVEAEPPDLFAPIRGTAMSWGDVSLSFLWWEGGTVIGEGMVRGQECVVLEIPAPPTESGFYARVRLWIDRHHRILLQAEGYDLNGRRLRRMQAKSFRKLGGEWMIKDIEIRRYPDELRTNLRVRDMGEVGGNATAL